MYKTVIGNILKFSTVPKQQFNKILTTISPKIPRFNPIKYCTNKINIICQSALFFLSIRVYTYLMRSVIIIKLSSASHSSSDIPCYDLFSAEPFGPCILCWNMSIN